MLHITTTGSLNNSDNIGIWEKVNEVSKEHQAKRVLIECRAAPGRISMDHCFELIEKLSQLCRSLACKVAFFKHHAGDETRELLRFVETAASDRGAHMKLFFDLEEAKLWVRK